VHAGSFIHKREMILESELRSDSRELTRIFAHELFHFVWARLGNPRRNAYAELLKVEMAAHARGELGWSAERMKGRCREFTESRTWRAYAAESFCDTAAFLYSGNRHHDEFTLARKWRLRRERWFRESLGRRPLSI